MRVRIFHTIKEPLLINPKRVCMCVGVCVRVRVYALFALNGWKACNILKGDAKINRSTDFNTGSFRLWLHRMSDSNPATIIDFLQRCLKVISPCAVSYSFDASRKDNLRRILVGMLEANKA